MIHKLYLLQNKLVELHDIALNISLENHTIENSHLLIPNIHFRVILICIAIPFIGIHHYYCTAQIIPSFCVKTWIS